MDSIEIINDTNILLKHFLQIIQTKSICIPLSSLKPQDDEKIKNNIDCGVNNKKIQHQPYIIITVTNENELIRFAKIVKIYISYFMNIHVQIIYCESDTLFALSKSSDKIKNINMYSNILLQKFLSATGHDNPESPQHKLLKGSLLTCQQFFYNNQSNAEYWQKLISNDIKSDIERQSIIIDIMIKSFVQENSLGILPLCGHLSFQPQLFPNNIIIKSHQNSQNNQDDDGKSVFFDYAIKNYQDDGYSDIFVSALLIQS